MSSYIDKLPLELLDTINSYRTNDTECNIIKKLLPVLLRNDYKNNECFNCFNNDNKEIIFYYLNYSILLRIIYEVQIKIIHEIKKEKCKRVKKYKITFNDNNDTKFVKRHLYFNKTVLNSYHEIFSLTKSTIEDIMMRNIKHLGNEYNHILTSIFYTENINDKIFIDDWKNKIPNFLSTEKKLNYEDKFMVKNVYFWHIYVINNICKEQNISKYEKKECLKMIKMLEKLTE